MAYWKRKGAGESPKLDMTPMIDVVFLLLIFFVVVVKQDDILSKLSASRPAQHRERNPIVTTTIVVDAQGFTFNGKPMNRGELDRQLGRVSMFSKTTDVMVKCTADSPHGMLVQALDLCTKHGLTNIALFSM